MKILERVEPNKKPWSMVIRCTGEKHGGHGCKSTMEIVAEDIKRVGSGDDDPDWRFVVCPVCGVSTELPAGTVVLVYAPEC